MKAEIIAVGTELMLGDIINTNAAFLSRELAELGFDMHYQTVVGDNEARLAEVVDIATHRSSLVVLCGGLGPTGDDLTKETVAMALGIKLIPDAKAQKNIDDYFLGRHICAAPNNKKQALVFEGGTTIYNDNGTAPGLFYSRGETSVLLLPGPPNELEPMFKDKVRPLLMGLTGQTIFSRTLRVFGIGESDLEYQLKDKMQSANPTVAPYAKIGEVHLRITAKAGSEGEARAKVEQKEAELREFIGDKLYSDCGRTLPETVVDILKRQNLTAATAESITGGGLAREITAVPGASRVFEYGFVTYSDNAKERILGANAKTLNEHTAVSAEVAKEMAEGAARLSGADISAAVTGYAGPDGANVGRVFAAVLYKGELAVKEFSFGNMRPREYIREIACKNVFDMMRRALLGMKI